LYPLLPPLSFFLTSQESKIQELLAAQEEQRQREEAFRARTEGAQGGSSPAVPVSSQVAPREPEAPIAPVENTAGEPKESEDDGSDAQSPTRKKKSSTKKGK
jgi:hypothetical protein